MNMSPDYSVVINIPREGYIKLEIGVNVTQDTKDCIHRLAKTNPGIISNHPSKEFISTFYGYEIKYNSCWSYPQIIKYLVEALIPDLAVGTIRINNLLEKKQELIDCTKYRK